MAASMRQDFLYSSPLSPPVGYPYNPTPQRGDSKMNASTAQRNPPTHNHSPSAPSPTSNKIINANINKHDVIKAYLKKKGTLWFDCRRVHIRVTGPVPEIFYFIFFIFAHLRGTLILVRDHRRS